MPSTRVRVRVPLCGSTIRQRPTITVSRAQIRRRITVPTEWAVKAPAIRKAPAISRIQPMKIAVPTEATSGTTIATQPITIARTPTAISAFQLRASPSRTPGPSRLPDLHERQPRSGHGRRPSRMAVNHRFAGGRAGARLAVDPGWCSRLARLVLVQEAGVRVPPPESPLLRAFRCLSGNNSRAEVLPGVLASPSSGISCRAMRATQGR